MFNKNIPDVGIGDGEITMMIDVAGSRKGRGETGIYRETFGPREIQGMTPRRARAKN